MTKPKDPPPMLKVPPVIYVVLCEDGSFNFHHVTAPKKLKSDADAARDYWDTRECGPHRVQAYRPMT